VRKFGFLILTLIFVIGCADAVPKGSPEKKTDVLSVLPPEPPLPPPPPPTPKAVSCPIFVGYVTACGPSATIVKVWKEVASAEACRTLCESLEVPGGICQFYGNPSPVAGSERTCFIFTVDSGETCYGSFPQSGNPAAQQYFDGGAKIGLCNSN
jgi:hypothetical protein